MADDEHVEMLKKGAAAWDRWRSENARVVLNLDEANLSASDFAGTANLSRANLSRANLSRTNLSRTNLSRTVDGWWSWAWRQWPRAGGE
jgi:hypothetical protein